MFMEAVPSRPLDICRAPYAKRQQHSVWQQHLVCNSSQNWCTVETVSVWVCGEPNSSEC